MHPKRSAAFVAAAGFAATLCVAAMPAQASSAPRNPRFTEYSVPTPNSGPNGITAGPDGAIWFTESFTGKIGRITTRGAITEYPTKMCCLNGIAAGPDGALWFGGNPYGRDDKFSPGAVGRITTSGVVRTFEFPIGPASGITAGPDGNMWFGTSVAVGKITMRGEITLYTVQGVYYYFDIAATPDGYLFFQVAAPGALTSSIARMDLSGNVTYFPFKHGKFGGTGVALGPNRRDVWAVFGHRWVGHIDAAGHTEQFWIRGPSAPIPTSITAGPDNAMWFTQAGTNRIGRVDLSGVMTQYAIPTPDAHPSSIVTGPDGALWFTEVTPNKIGRLQP
jgi:virginiamycin B lyase